MKVFRSLEAYEQVHKPVVTIGTFDGVHIGHQKILDRLNALARDKGGESLLLTFWPHPRFVLQPDNDLHLLNSLDEKIQLLDEYGLDNLVIVPFTLEFSRLPAIEFIRDLLVNTLGTSKLVIGHDHRFGKNRQGTFEDLEEGAETYGYELEQIPPQEIDDVTVSSTKIRNALLEGSIEQANDYLGHPYLLKGTVVKGDQLGRTLGYPTANIEPDHERKLVPVDGVYLVRVTVSDQQHFGLFSIGNRPTIQSQGEKRLEVYILDFDEDIYEAEIQVEFLQWIRGDKAFDSKETLIEQMDQDLAKARSAIS